MNTASHQQMEIIRRQPDLLSKILDHRQFRSRPSMHVTPPNRPPKMLHDHFEVYCLVRVWFSDSIFVKNRALFVIYHRTMHVFRQTKRNANGTIQTSNVVGGTILSMSSLQRRRHLSSNNQVNRRGTQFLCGSEEVCAAPIRL